jgi:hypothetical protein
MSVAQVLLFLVGQIDIRLLYRMLASTSYHPHDVWSRIIVFFTDMAWCMCQVFNVFPATDADSCCAIIVDSHFYVSQESYKELGYADALVKRGAQLLP